MLEVSVLKMLCGIDAGDTSKDAVLGFMLDDVSEIICNYCNISRVPEGLKNTAYRMAAELYRNESLGGISTASTGPVTQITEGGDSVSFATTGGADSNYANSLIKAYEAQLKRFRRLAW